MLDSYIKKGSYTSDSVDYGVCGCCLPRGRTGLSNRGSLSRCW